LKVIRVFLLVISCTSVGVYANTNDKVLQSIEEKISTKAAQIYTNQEQLLELNSDITQLTEKIKLENLELAKIKDDMSTQVQLEYSLKNLNPMKILLNSKNLSQVQRQIFYLHKLQNLSALDFANKQEILKNIQQLKQKKSKQQSKAHAYQLELNEHVKQLKQQYYARKNFLHKNKLDTSKNDNDIKHKVPSKPATKLQTIKKFTAPLPNIKISQLHYIQENRVLIPAEEGTKVHAVNHGSVLFSGWLRGYGMIIILDHGNNIMSLYGHNQTLLKRAGEVVKKGETISLVGKSGGQAKGGLYFEIRQNGQPSKIDKWITL